MGFEEVDLNHLEMEKFIKDFYPEVELDNTHPEFRERYLEDVINVFMYGELELPNRYTGRVEDWEDLYFTRMQYHALVSKNVEEYFKYSKWLLFRKDVDKFNRRFKRQVRSL